MSRKFDGLVAIVRKLRSSQGCPWDRQQTHRTIQNYLIEEAYELADAVESRSSRKLREELGDVLMLLVFHARIAQEAGAFSLPDVLNTINQKLVRRHPHVFKNTRADTVKQVADNWEQIKQQEKKRDSVLAGVPRHLPALARALRLQQRAARVGFDWEKIDDVFAKVDEEIAELKKEYARGRRKKWEDELGDTLFALVNLARFLDINPEAALRKTLRKFNRRFRYIEKTLRRQKKNIMEASLAQLDRLWNEAKVKLK